MSLDNNKIILIQREIHRALSSGKITPKLLESRLMSHFSNLIIQEFMQGYQRAEYKDIDLLQQQLQQVNQLIKSEIINYGLIIQTH